MEIRNNTPSFGMAFRKPQDMEKFTKYVVGNSFEFMPKRGLQRVVNEQAGNAHFDIEYRADRNNFVVIPTSAQARKFGYKDMLISGSLPYSDTSSRLSFKYFGDEYKENYQAASRVKKISMSVNKFFAGLRILARKCVTHPEESLPKALRNAAATATQKEAEVNARIVKEAKSLAKKQKLEASINSVFPKDVE